MSEDSFERTQVSSAETGSQKPYAEKRQIGIEIPSIHPVSDIMNIDVLGFSSPEFKKEAVFRRYEDAMRKGSVVEMKFPLSDRDTYMAFEQGVTIMFPRPKDENFVFTSAEISKSRLNQTFRLCVEAVDREKSLVLLKKHPEEAKLRKELEDGLLASVTKGEGIEVPAMVVAVRNGFNNDREVLFVDIAGMGIPGSIRLIEWSSCFTESFQYAAKLGEVVNVVVCGVSHWNSGNLFDCSRRLALKEDPWKDIEKKAPHNANVRVTCISLARNRFYGMIDGISDLNCYCEYPDKDLNIRIAPGIEYVGYVSRVNEANRLLRVRITGYAKE